MQKIAIVTGAAKGMGESITFRLINEGYTVVAIDIDKEGLDQLEEKVGDRNVIKCVADIG
mgnify:CR=1 FL=1